MLYVLFGASLLVLLKITTISNSIISLIMPMFYTSKTQTYYILLQAHGMVIIKLTTYRPFNQPFLINLEALIVQEIN